MPVSRTWMWRTSPKPPQRTSAIWSAFTAYLPQRHLLGHEGVPIGDVLQRYQFSYNERPPVELVFYNVLNFTGVPVNYEFEQILWAEAVSLPDYDFLEGDREFIDWLSARAKE